MVLIYFFVALGFSSLCFTIELLIKYFEIEITIFGYETKDILRVIEIVGWTLLWYAISISFTLFNKWFMNIWNDGFHFPIFTTAIQMVMKTVLSQLWARCYTKKVIQSLSWALFCSFVFPIGLLTGTDIMLSNLALQYISVTNYTLLKSSELLWTFIWAIGIGAMAFQWRTFLSVLTISIGLSLATLQSTQLEVIGAVFVLSASCAAGLRWALLQLLITKDPLSKNSFGSIYRFSPASAMAVVPLALILEVPSLVSSKFVGDNILLLKALAFTVVSGCMAFLSVSVEIQIFQLTSSVTLSVIAQFKEIFQIIFAVILFGDSLSPINIFGVVLSSIGALTYKEGDLEPSASDDTKEPHLVDDDDPFPSDIEDIQTRNTSAFSVSPTYLLVPENEAAEIDSSDPVH